MGVVSLMISLFLVLFMYWACDSRRVAIQREIGVAEKTSHELSKEIEREQANLDTLTDRDSLDDRLTRSGLATMKVVSPNQVIRMRRDGRPIPSAAVTYARNRAQNSANMAYNKLVPSAEFRSELPSGRSNAGKNRKPRR